MSEQRVTTLVVEVAGRKAGLDAVLQGLQRELRATAQGAQGTVGQIEGVGQASGKSSKEVLQLAQAAQRLATEQQKTAVAATRIATEEAKAAAAQTRAATEGAKLAQAQNRVAQSEQQAALAGQRLATESQRTAAAQSRAEQAALRLAQAQERGRAGNTSWSASIGQTAGAVDGFIGTLTGLGGAFAVVSAAQGLYSFAQQGAAIDAARKSFDNLAQSAGTSGAALLRSLQQAASGTVSNANIIKSSNTALLLLGSSVASQLPQLLAVAKASATTLGTDVGQVFDSLVTGISRGSTELIDNAGITVKAGQAYEAYAASLGKSADQLSASEKQQALLNAVLTSGQAIIDQTSGGSEAAGASFQRFNASSANLLASLQSLAANGLAPTVDWLGRIAQSSSDGITALQQIGTKSQDLNTQLLAGAGSYEQYAQRVAQAQALADQALNEAYAGDPIGRFVAQISGAVPQVEALSRAQVELALQMQAGGASVEASFANVAAATPAMDLLGRAIDYAAVRTPDAVASIQALEPVIVATATASDQARAQVEQMLATYITGGLTAQELATGLQNIELSANAAAAAAQLQAGASAEAQAALFGYSEAATGATVATLDQTAAMNAASLAKLQEQAAAEQTAVAHQNLDAAIRAAAAAGGDAEAAAARIAAQFAGVELPQVLALINAHRQLAAARAGAAASTAAAMADFRAGERSPANDPGRAAFLEKMAANRLKYEQEQARLAARSAGVGRSAGGGGAGGGAAAAAERQAAQQTRLQSQLTQNEFKEQQQRENAAREHYQKLIDIQADYAAKTLEQQEQNQATSRRSKFNFYKELTSAEDIPQTVAQGLSAQYEQAFAEAQQMSQEGKAQLAADYLALKQEQIAAELAYQQELAKAREEGDKGEVARLEALAKLRKDAEQAELSNLLSGGDANVNQRDQALAGEEQRYTESQDKIGTAAEQAAQRKILAAQQSGAALAAETTELQRQADLYAQMGKGGTGTTGTATATMATPAPALPTTGPNGGAVAVTDATLAALFADAVKALDGLRREMSNLASRPPLTTG